MYIPLYILAAGGAFTVLLILASRNPDWLKRKRRAGQQVPRMDNPPPPPPQMSAGMLRNIRESYARDLEQFRAMTEDERMSKDGRSLAASINQWRKVLRHFDTTP